MMPEELRALTEELHATTVMLGQVIDRLDKADERANRHRAWTAVLAACVLGIVGVGVWTVASLNSSRDQSRLTYCESYNTDTVDRINGLLLAIGRDSRDPVAAMKRIEPLLLPHRDCSPEGIAAYFDDDPATDPFVPVTIP